MSESLPNRCSTLIIGGGPAGLVSLKYLVEYGPEWATGEEPVLVEMEPEIGGTFRWVASSNDRLRSVLLTCQMAGIPECRAGQQQTADLLLRLPVPAVLARSPFAAELCPVPERLL